MKNLLFAKKLRKNQTDAEHRIWRYLRAKRYCNFKFKRQKPIGPYIVDFICLELQLIIEVDDGQHSEQIAYDLKRTRWLEKRGFFVIRFWNNDVLCNLEGVFGIIEQTIEKMLADRRS